MNEPEVGPHTYHFAHTMEECRLISLALGMLARAAYEGGNIPGMDMANGLSARYNPKTLRESEG